ncbi:IucC family-domain-containing protein [Crucibulum laeve]|uniref:IucC family-domain-containing protein n=1 Tax=Crucibulum laeve TaxID=68775 RepID=A0A5C3MG48_9AGAR|nr:IucC family-domain-containing protein [Crucibulum laeve]
MSTIIDSSPPLTSKDRAAFATTARLLSCLVTESLARAVYYPLTGFEATGICVILSGNAAVDKPLYQSQDILAVIPLSQVPIFKHDGTDHRGREIGLLDPLDMMKFVFEIPNGEGLKTDAMAEHSDLIDAILSALASPGWAVSTTTLTLSQSPTSIWSKFADAISLESALSMDIASELESAVKWQKYSYEHPPQAPLFESSSVEWEQSIVEGHPTHPMHKTRRFLPPLQDLSPGSIDLYHPQLRFVSVPRENLKITYEFEELVRPLVDAASKAADALIEIPEGHVVIPVHELQVVHIHDKFSDAIIYPEKFSIPLLAQQSIRSVIVPNVYREHSLKLGVGIKLTSAVRTISPESAYLGPRFSAKVVPALNMDQNVVTVAKELASVVHAHSNGEIAKHCAAIVREAHENTSEERGERLIVCTALVESGHSGCDGHLPAVIRVFNLDTERKKVEWLDKFVDVFFKAFLPSMLTNGVAFECHPQNCVARFDIKTKVLKGFIIRDFGGLRVHPATLRETTGIELDFIEGHSIVAPDLEDVYTRMYHTVIHNHLQQLIRVLGLHYNGLGWAIVRRHLEAHIPRDHALYAAWLSPDRKTFPGKCFLRMRMSGMYRFHLHGPFPNLIHYCGVNME